MFFSNKAMKSLEELSAEAVKRGLEIQIKLKKAQLAAIALELDDNGAALDADRLTLLADAMELYSALLVLMPTIVNDLSKGVVLSDIVTLRKYAGHPLKFEINY